MNMVRSIGLFAAAGLAEIGGGYYDWLGAVIVALGVAVIFFSPRHAS